MGPPSPSKASSGMMELGSPIGGTQGGSGLARRGSLLDEEPACSSRLRRIFRYALLRVLDADHGVTAMAGGGDAAASALEEGTGDDGGNWGNERPAALSASSLRGLEAEAKARLPAEVMTLLERLVEAERAAATGAQGHGYWPSASAAAAAPGTGGEQTAGQGGRRQGGLASASGKKRRLRESLGGGGKPRRRVSFSTFDLSVVDTPDPQRHGSDRPMEGVLSSLFLALKAAEALRAGCHEAPLAGIGGGGVVAGGISAVQQLMAAAAGVVGGGAGKENEHLQQQGQGQGGPAASPARSQRLVDKPSGERGEAAAGPGAVLDAAAMSSGPDGAGGGASNVCVERLVAALGELAEQAGKASAPLDAESGQGRALALLGEHPNWSEVAAAALFYAKELRLLCLGPAEELPGSRLLERYHETLSSMVRYELKKVLNLCYCNATGFGDDDTPQHQQHPHPLVNTGLPAHEAAHGACAAHEHAAPGGGAGIEACCSALQIIMETAANLQYNSDDPAALVHFALQRLARKRPAWLAFAAATDVGGGQDGADGIAAALRWGAESKGGEDGDGAPNRSVLGAEGEEDSNLMSLASQQDAGAAPAPSPRIQEVGAEEDGEPGAARRRRFSSTNSLPFPAPRWWPLAEAQGEEVLGYLSAASFLLRVLQDPVVAQAVGKGRWRRVERFAGMVSGAFGVPSEDDCLRALGDLGLFAEQLQGELQAAQAVREALLASCPPDVLAAVPASHYPGIGGGGHHAQQASKKRKRAARFIKGQMRNVLVWARSCELPPALTYPQLVPLCVYALPPMLEPGAEEGGWVDSGVEHKGEAMEA